VKTSEQEENDKVTTWGPTNEVRRHPNYWQKRPATHIRWRTAAGKTFCWNSLVCMDVSYVFIQFNNHV